MQLQRPNLRTQGPQLPFWKELCHNYHSACWYSPDASERRSLVLSRGAAVHVLENTGDYYTYDLYDDDNETLVASGLDGVIQFAAKFEETHGESILDLNILCL